MSKAPKTPSIAQISSKINISLLQTFHHVARTGSFSAASRELGISYQSAANHVRRLEQIYAVRLVTPEKGARRIRLTAEGSALYNSLGSELDIILARIGNLMRDVGSTLRVGVPQALFHHFFPRVTREFLDGSPDTALEYFERDATLERMMNDGALDVAVSERNFSSGIVTQTLLGTYRLALICPRAWQADGRIGPLGDLVSRRGFISYEANHMIRTQAIEYLTRHAGCRPRVTVSTSGSTSITELVSAGLGYAVVPEWCAPAESDRITRMTLDGIEPITVWFAHTALLSGNPHVRRLLRCCRDAISSETLQ